MNGRFAQRSLFGILLGFCLTPLLLHGCADGGVGGTGISSVVQGNVVNLTIPEGLKTTAAAGGGGSIAGVRVTVLENAEISDVTDSDGTFMLEGVFPELATIEFRRGTDPPKQTRIFVMAESSINMVDVDLSGTSASPNVESIGFDFDGAILEAVDCTTTGGALRVRDKAGAPFEVSFDNGAIQNRPGCDALCIGSELGLIGEQSETGLVASNIRVIRTGDCLP